MVQCNHRVLERGREEYVMMKTECQSEVTDDDLKVLSCWLGERAHAAMNAGSPYKLEKAKKYFSSLKPY